MQTLKRAWHYLLAEPFKWIFYAFFQPNRFSRELEPAKFAQRVVPMLRLGVPMFLVAYPIGLIESAFFIALHLVYYSNIISFLLDTALSIMVGIMVGITAGIALGIALGIAAGIAQGIAQGIAAGITFTASYFIGYYRLPLYLASGPSVLKAYLASRANPAQVFTYLHHSALHWDEYVFLPLPYLKPTLLIASQENVEQALEEIAFIAAERPLQLRAARQASLEIAIRDLEMCKSLAEIIKAEQCILKIFPPDTKLMDPRWVTPFARLRDASQDAARASSPIGRQARYNALEEMKANLRKVHPNVAFRDQRLNRRLGKVIDTWLETAQREQDKLAHAPQDIGRIDNPYKPGQVLKPSDETLFVGRLDLAQQLEEALARGDRRPTFLLNGERRMGKSSTLLQLPVLLGSHYLTAFYDLQKAGVLANSAAFLGTVAAEIYSVMYAKGLKVRQLDYDVLKEARKENDAAVYHTFNRWLNSVESVLELEERSLLLTFDEFEQLAERQVCHLDLPLLFGWFRNIIQYHPRLALLFSGVRTFSEMGADWGGYFVNVQALRVSFLKRDEALRLITQPTPDFPGDEVFGDGVVEKIIAATGCHPFLIQAVCSALIDNLNADKRQHADMSDVDTAIEQVLESWNGYFADLWRRTDDEQRACLATLRTLGEEGDLTQIEQHSELDKSTTRRTMQTLVRRDLVSCNEDGTYRIATPIFSAWVEQSA